MVMTGISKDWRMLSIDDPTFVRKNVRWTDAGDRPMHVAEVFVNGARHKRILSFDLRALTTRLVLWQRNPAQVDP